MFQSAILAVFLLQMFSSGFTLGFDSANEVQTSNKLEEMSAKIEKLEAANREVMLILQKLQLNPSSLQGTMNFCCDIFSLYRNADFLMFTLYIIFLHYS